MASTPISVKTLEEGLQTYYLPGLVSEISEKSGPIYRELVKNKVAAGGKESKFAMTYGRHGGVGARGELDPLPDASPRMFKQGTYNVKALEGQMQISEMAIQATKDNPATYVDALKEEVRTLRLDVTDMLARNLCHSYTGVFGKLGAAASAVATLSVTGTLPAFYEGQAIDVLTEGAPPTYKAQGVKIVSVDRDARAITLSSAVTAAKGDAITLAGDYKKELTGIADILQKNNTIYGIDRSVHKFFNPVYRDKAVGNAPQTIDPLWLQAAINDVRDLSGEEPKFFVCNHGVALAYVEYENFYKRNVEYEKIDGGYSVIKFAGVPIVEDKYMMPNAIALLATDNWKIAQLDEWKWLERDGGGILSRVPNHAIWTAALIKFAELLCVKPSANAIITGIAEKSA